MINAMCVCVFLLYAETKCCNIKCIGKKKKRGLVRRMEESKNSGKRFC